MAIMEAAAIEEQKPDPITEELQALHAPPYMMEPDNRDFFGYLIYEQPPIVGVSDNPQLRAAQTAMRLTQDIFPATMTGISKLPPEVADRFRRLSNVCSHFVKGARPAVTTETVNPMPLLLTRTLGKIIGFESWMLDGVCNESDPGLFAARAPKGTLTPEEKLDEDARIDSAREKCGECAVSAECLEYALSHRNATPGVFAGTTYGQRVNMLKKRATEAKKKFAAEMAAVSSAGEVPQTAEAATIDL